MRHRSVADLMTHTAVTVRRTTAFKEVDRLLKATSPPCPCSTNPGTRSASSPKSTFSAGGPPVMRQQPRS